MNEIKELTVDDHKKEEIQQTEVDREIEEVLEEYEDMDPEKNKKDKDKYIIAKPKRIIVRARIKK